MSTPFDIPEAARGKWLLIRFLKTAKATLRLFKCLHCDLPDRLKVSECQNLPGWAVLTCRICGRYQKARYKDGAPAGIEVEKHVELYPGEGR